MNVMIKFLMLASLILACNENDTGGPLNPYIPPDPITKKLPEEKIVKATEEFIKNDKSITAYRFYNLDTDITNFYSKEYIIYFDYQVQAKITDNHQLVEAIENKCRSAVAFIFGSDSYAKKMGCLGVAYNVNYNTLQYTTIGCLIL